MFWAVPAKDLRFRWSMATAYAGLALLGAALLAGPINVLRARRNPVSTDLRRDIGIWSALVGVAHVVVGIQVHMGDPWLYFLRGTKGARELALRADLFGFANYTGLLATLILVLLLTLSNDWSLRALGGRRWKAWQRWSYGLIGLVVMHGAAYQVIEKRKVPYVVLFVVLAAAVAGVQFIGFRARRRQLDSERLATRRM